MFLTCSSSLPEANEEYKSERLRMSSEAKELQSPLPFDTNLRGENIITNIKSNRDYIYPLTVKHGRERTSKFSDIDKNLR